MVLAQIQENHVFDVVGFGELMVEFIEDGNFSNNNKEYIRGIGGDVYNTLYSLSLMNVKTSFISSVGNDMFKEYMLEKLTSYSVDIQKIYVDFDYNNGIYFIQDTPDLNKIIQTYRDKSAASYSLNEFSYPKILEFAMKAKIFYCTGITLAICTKKELLIKLLKELHDNNVLVAYDTNVRPQLWDGNLKFEKETEENILPYVHMVLLTKEDTLEEISVNTEEKLVDYYRSFNIDHIVVKDGANGATYYNPKNMELIHVPAITDIKVIDTTGAGDAFNGGFLSGYLNELSMEECLLQGVKLATACIQVIGAINYKV